MLVRWPSPRAIILNGRFADITMGCPRTLFNLLVVGQPGPIVPCWMWTHWVTFVTHIYIYPDGSTLPGVTGLPHGARATRQFTLLICTARSLVSPTTGVTTPRRWCHYLVPRLVVDGTQTASPER